MSVKTQMKRAVDWLRQGHHGTASRHEWWAVLLVVAALVVIYQLFIRWWLDAQLYAMMNQFVNVELLGYGALNWLGYLRDFIQSVVVLPAVLLINWLLLIVGVRRLHALGFRVFFYPWLLMLPVALDVLKPAADLLFSAAASNADGPLNERASAGMLLLLHWAGQLCMLFGVVCRMTVVLTYLFPLGVLRTCSRRNARFFRCGVVVVFGLLALCMASSMRW